MNSNNIAALQKRFKQCQDDKTLKSFGFTFEMMNSDHWRVTFPASNASVYYPKKFTLDVTFPVTFPTEKPTIKFYTKIYHCNVGDGGKICLEILNNWKMNSVLADVFLNIYVLLIKPNPFSPLRSNIAQEMQNDPRNYIKNAYANSGNGNY